MDSEMTKDLKNKLINKIWFTYSARIKAHKRISQNNLFANLLLCLYSLSATICSVAALSNGSFLGRNTSILLIVLSLIIFIFSLLLGSYNFSLRAYLMRDNYIDLQELYNKLEYSDDLDFDSLKKYVGEYSSILRRYENHSSIDDISHRFSTKTTRDLTVCEYIYFFTYKTSIFLFYFILFLFPLVLTFFAICEML